VEIERKRIGDTAAAAYMRSRFNLFLVYTAFPWTADV
jgi:hypothetical protein